MLPELERYYDAVPRSAARAEQIGGLTLFVKSGPGFPYYARPSLGTSLVAAEDVRRVRSRQRALGIPETFEWVAETTPAMRAAVGAAGLAVVDYPLMVLREHARVDAAANRAVIRLVRLEDDFALLQAVAGVAFGAPGTAVGPAGVDAARAWAASADPALIEFDRDRLRRGNVVRAVALVDGQPVGVGLHVPVGKVTEVAGVGVLPAFRRSGIGAALTSALTAEALGRGIQTVFLSAGDATIARVYNRIGFERVGTACAAQPPGSHSE